MIKLEIPMHRLPRFIALPAVLGLMAMLTWAVYVFSK